MDNIWSSIVPLCISGYPMKPLHG